MQVNSFDKLFASGTDHIAHLTVFKLQKFLMKNENYGIDAKNFNNFSSFPAD